MPATLTEARALLGAIQKRISQDFDKGNLLYVSRLQDRRTAEDEVTWLQREEDFGMSPFVSGGQLSPIVPQGDYSQYRTKPIETRHVKRFTDEELRNLLSPDKNLRIDTAYHIEQEARDMWRRVYQTMEFVAHSATTRAALRYVSKDPSNPMDINLSFGIKSKTAAASWATSSTDIPGHIQAWLDEYQLSGYRKPDLMRMSTKVWRLVKTNTNVKALLTHIVSYNKTPEEAYQGHISPEFIARAMDWPPIEIYDERIQVKFTVAGTVTSGSTKTITLNEGTFGLNVGDVLLLKYSNGSWDNEATISSITHGTSVVVTTLPIDLAAGDVVVAKPTLHPDNYVLFTSDEKANLHFTSHPFGIELVAGAPSPNRWYGPRLDAFMQGPEPNLAVFRRIWRRLGFVMRDPLKLMSCKVIT